MIQIDNAEPLDIARALEPAITIDIRALNSDGWADFVWSGEAVSHWPGHDGTYQTEHKTWTDCAGNIEEIEDLLRRQQEAHPKALHRLVIEGAIEPHPMGVLVYSRAGGRNVLLPRQLGRPGTYKAIMGKIAGWYEFLDVYFSTGYPGTAGLLLELYQRDQKPEEERNTFRKHYKNITWHPNKQVERLLGITSNDVGWGVATCEALIAKFGTVWAVSSASPAMIAEVRGISTQGALQFLRKIGRMDV